jgi:hypothetical protein
MAGRIQYGPGEGAALFESAVRGRGVKIQYSVIKTNIAQGS